MPLLSWRDWKEGNLPEPYEPPLETLSLSPVDKLNEATADQLQTIKGIGPKMAEKILSQAPYKNVEALQEILNGPLYSRVECWLSSKNEI